MTDDEFSYHMKHGKNTPYGLCSIMKDGRIKVEGYPPMSVEEVLKHRELQPLGVLDYLKVPYGRPG